MPPRRAKEKDETKKKQPRIDVLMGNEDSAGGQTSGEDESHNASDSDNNNDDANLSHKVDKLKTDISDIKGLLQNLLTQSVTKTVFEAQDTKITNIQTNLSALATEFKQDSQRLDEIESTITLIPNLEKRIESIESEIPKSADKIIQQLNIKEVVTGVMHEMLPDLDMEKVNKMTATYTAQKSEIDALKSDVFAMRGQFRILKENANAMYARRLADEKRSRQWNIRVKGFEAGNHADSARHLDLLMTYLELEVSFDAVHYTGASWKNGDKTYREIIAKVHQLPKREIIIKRAKEKFSVLQNHGIIVSIDNPPEIRNDRRHLARAKYALFKGGRAASFDTDGKLRIDEYSITIYTIHSLPTDLLKLITDFDQKRKDNRLAFFGRLSPFSNHFKLDIKTVNHTWSSSEQLYFGYMLSVIQDPRGLAEIMFMVDPGQIKREAQNQLAKASDDAREDWYLKRKNAMYFAVSLKFTRTSLKNFLSQTVYDHLVEASSDPFWGSGVPIRKPEAADPGYAGQNELGKILMRVRNDIRTDKTPRRIPDPVEVLDYPRLLE